MGNSELSVGKLSLGSGGEAQAVPGEGKPAERARTCPQSGSPVECRRGRTGVPVMGGRVPGRMEDVEALASPGGERPGSCGRGGSFQVLGPV